MTNVAPRNDIARRHPVRKKIPLSIKPPLHLAGANNGKDALAIAQRLIENHADVNAADKSGGTPLDCASQQHTGLFGGENSNSGAMFELLKKHGAMPGKSAAP